MNEKELTSSFKALSCETRRKIIYLLKSKCLCAGDIAKHFELTGATISHHLTNKFSIVLSEVQNGNFNQYKVWKSNYYQRARR